MESKLISAVFSSREAYDSVNQLLDDNDLSDIGQILYDAAADYYNRDESAQYVDVDIIRDKLVREYPKKADMFNAALNNIKDVSVPNIIAEYAAVKKEHTGHKIITAIQTGADNEIIELLNEYQNYAKGDITTHSLDVRIGESIQDIVEHTSGGGLVPLYPGQLNDTIDGGVVPGSHILVFARPDGGKSLFSINTACKLAESGRKVLYVGNEDPAEQMILRIVSSLTGMSKLDIIRDPLRAEAIAMDTGYDNIIFASLAPGSIAELKILVDEYAPDVLIVDQLRNLHVAEQNRVLQLEKAAVGVRTIGKEYGITCFSVTQAGDSADGKLVLDMGDVDFSNTGIPAQVDLMIGIGVNDDLRNAGQMMLSICKNKVNGYYGHFPVEVDRLTSRIIR